MSTTVAEPAGPPTGPVGNGAGGGPDAAVPTARREVRRAPPRFGGKPWWRPDCAAVITFWLGLLLLVPARLVVGPIGGAGRPAVLLGLALLAWWGVSRVVPYLVTRGRNPMRLALMVFGAAFVVIYGLDNGRGLPSIEARAADRQLLIILSLVGAALITADGVARRDRLDTLLKRFTVVAAIVALIGVIQFVFGIDLAAQVRLPGLRINDPFNAFKERGDVGFRRVNGTAGHSIEFGVVMAVLLPVALHYALHSGSRRERFWRWVVVTLIGVGVPFSVSRSGIIALAVIAVVLGIAWAPEVKLKATAVATMAVGVFSVVVPGLLGTIRSSFVNFDDDPSVEGRTSDYTIAFSYINDRPWIGRGPGTFMPSRYIVLDNEVLYTLVTTGYIGLGFLVMLVWAGVHVARKITRYGRDDTTRHLAQALMASVVASAVVMVTFDALSFAQYGGVLFFALGALGALWRLDRLGDQGTNPPRQTRLLKPWRSADRPEPHPLQQMFPRYSVEHGWRSRTYGGVATPAGPPTGGADRP